MSFVFKIILTPILVVACALWPIAYLITFGDAEGAWECVTFPLRYVWIGDAA